MSKGFIHDNRGVGIRHHQLILPSVICSTHVARRIANETGAISFAHQHGCAIIGDDVAGIDDFFADLAAHPNVSSVLIVGLGCETTQGQELGARLVAENPSTKYQIIQESGGVEGTVTAGVKAAQLLTEKFPETVSDHDVITVGLDLSTASEYSQELERAIQGLGMEVIAKQHSGSSIDNFSTLMRAKAHLIISFPSENQPASGFPLIPVINIASTSALHLATAKDFDLQSGAPISLVLETLAKTISGALTKAEANKAGEIRAPRLVRSV